MNRVCHFVRVLGVCLTLAILTVARPSAGLAQGEPLAITHGPYLQAATASSITVIWFTNKKCVSQVDYAPLESFGDPAQRKTARNVQDGLIDSQQTRHVITLDGLTPGTRYGYRIQATEVRKYQPYHVDFGEAVSLERQGDRPLSFVTLDPRKAQCSFSVVNDIHEKSAHLAAMLKLVPWESTDFLVMNGDTLNHFEQERQLFDGFLDVCVGQFASQTPFILVRGNHETRGAMARQLRGYFPTATDRYYYSFQQGPVRFLVLDSGEDKPDDSHEYSGLVAFDPYRLQEVEWLKKAMAEPEFQQSPYKIVLMHMPLFGGNDWYGEKKNRELFLPLLNQAGIDLALSGHTHKYARIDAQPEANRFPIVIGDTQTVVRVDATAEGLQVVVQNADGSQKDALSVPKRPQ